MPELEMIVEQKDPLLYIHTSDKADAAVVDQQPTTTLTAAVKKIHEDTQQSKEEEEALVFLDTETTGLGIYSDRIFEIASVIRYPNGQTAEFVTRMCPQIPICPEASEKTGVRTEDLKNEPPCKIGLLKWLKWLKVKGQGYRLVLVAQNGIGFDFPILMSEMERCGIPLLNTLKKIGVHRLFDSLLWFKTFLMSHHLIKKDTGEPSFALGDIYESFFSRRFDNAHSAVADTVALMELCLCDRLPVKFSVPEEDCKYSRSLALFVQDFTKRYREVEKKQRKRAQASLAEGIGGTLTTFFKRIRH